MRDRDRLDLEQRTGRYEELTQMIAQPDILADRPRWTALMKEQAELEPLIRAWRAYTEWEREREEAQAMLEEPDAELRDMAREEMARLEGLLEDKQAELYLMMTPKDPDDDKNAILEVRGGAGGEEAALFAADLVRMYSRYAEKRGWRMEVESITETELEGVKEGVYLVQGKGVYGRLKYESGGHRVQRIPVTESGGRIHTSAATVAVLPEQEEKGELQIDPKELRIDLYRSSGAGGQHINKTESAVRLTHLPTGIVVACQSQRSQIQNRARAMQILMARLADREAQQEAATLSATRRSLVGSGDRSERVRTYNFPQNRVTDHRINLTLYQLDSFMEGDCDEMLDALARAESQLKTEE